MENWKKGKQGGTVITDSMEGYPRLIEEDVNEYYGGNLVCESIGRSKDVALISAAPDMLEALQNLENDDNSIPEKIWRKVQDAITKATGL